MAAYGSPGKMATIALPAPFPRTNGIITSSGVTQASGISSPATSRLVPRRSLRRRSRRRPGGQGVYLDFADAIRRLGESQVREKYGNLFDMYEEITGENAYKVPMRIFQRSITPWAACGSITT